MKACMHSRKLFRKRAKLVFKYLVLALQSCEAKKGIKLLLFCTRYKLTV